MLQRALGVPAYGAFGPQTGAAVRAAQARAGLTVDGIVGPATWRALCVRGQATISPPASAQPRPAVEVSAPAQQVASPTAGSSAIVQRVIAAGDRIATLPYRYGGGHGSFTDTAYDCSGSVSYALHGGGLIDAPQASVQLESYGQAGPGQRITVYANAQHAYMVVDGRRFDTSGREIGGSRWTSATRSGFVARHPAGL